MVLVAMALIDPKPIPKDKTINELAKFFNETLGFCPNSILTMQIKPSLAEAFINLNMAVMQNEAQMSSEFKRLIAFISSSASGCAYCQAHTIRAAERYGANEERLKNIACFESSDSFTPKEKSALKFAQESSTSPVSLTKETTDELKKYWNEIEIIEITSVIALFGFLNRWNDVMATPIEEQALQSATNLIQNWDKGKH